jgi:hypothetical protein
VGEVGYHGEADGGADHGGGDQGRSGFDDEDTSQLPGAAAWAWESSLVAGG